MHGVRAQYDAVLLLGEWVFAHVRVELVAPAARRAALVRQQRAGPSRTGKRRAWAFRANRRTQRRAPTPQQRAGAGLSAAPRRRAACRGELRRVRAPAAREPKLLYACVGGRPARAHGRTKVAQAAPRDGTHRRRQLLLDRPSICAATWLQLRGPCCSTRRCNSASSCARCGTQTRGGASGSCAATRRPRAQRAACRAAPAARLAVSQTGHVIQVSRGARCGAPARRRRARTRRQGTRLGRPHSLVARHRCGSVAADRNAGGAVFDSAARRSCRARFCAAARLPRGGHSQCRRCCSALAANTHALRTGKVSKIPALSLFCRTTTPSHGARRT